MAGISSHRGPDDQGFFLDNEIGLGQTRLSIIDLVTGHQPIANEDQTVWVACNGEIYNFRELREDLKQAGHIFRTGSDSEVLVHLYEEAGEALVERLDGMYAFALWDSRKKKLLICKDRLGIKPLYFVSNDKFFAFASEAKALITLPGVSPEIDQLALREYLSLGYVSSPRSLFKNLRKLPPATLLTIEGKEVREQRYWTPPAEVSQELGEAEWVASIRSQLEQSVSSHLVSDVPLGAFLSGGIDSSAIVALMAGMSDKPIRTYAIGFEDSGAGSYYNELPYARQVADKYKTSHREIIVKPDTANLLPKLIWHLDEPIADSAFVTTYLVSQFAKEDVTVILSGVGGDELFGGYRRYQGEYYKQYYHLLPNWLRSHVLSPLVAKLPSDRHNAVLNFFRYLRSFIMTAELSPEESYRAYVQAFSPSQVDKLLVDKISGTEDGLDHAFRQHGSNDSLQRLVEIDMATQLPDDLLHLTDRMSMATSLECRVPFLDHHMVELAARMPSRFKMHRGKLKYILKKSLSDLLPGEILYRKKRGFGAPMGAWIKGDLAPMLKTLLGRESVESRGLFDWATVDKTISLHLAQKEDHTDHLLALINFEIWARMYIDNRSPDDVSQELAGNIAT